MIIDAHTHVYPEKIVKKAIAKLEANSGVSAKVDGRKPGLIASMKKAGINYSVLLPVATSPRQVEAINEEAGQTNATAEETGLLSFGGIHPDTENYKEVLKQVKALGLKGIKLHPDYQGTFFSDIRYKRIVEKATELGLYCMVHAGEDIGLPNPVHCTPESVKEMLRETDTDKLILAHMGGWRMWQQVEELLAGENVYFDTAFSLDNIEGVSGLLSKEEFVHLVRAHGAERIVFGTDSPWSDQKESVDWIMQTDLTEDEKEKIFAGNMRKILDL